jgi:hypothetical protein
LSGLAGFTDATSNENDWADATLAAAMTARIRCRTA